MNTAIFIKTCRKDLEWLKWSLQSIRKFCSGFSEVVIVADEDCRSEIEKITTSERVEFCPVHHNGYIQQQIVKIEAYRYIRDAELILFVDSDVIFHTKCTPEAFTINGIPFLLKTLYGNLGGAEAWKPITERFCGFHVMHEYMRRMPLAFKRATLIRFWHAYREKIAALNEMQGRDFSEFNALGAYAAATHPNEYHIIDTERDSVPQPVAKQYWSWGGISDEIVKEMEQFLS